MKLFSGGCCMLYESISWARDKINELWNVKFPFSVRRRDGATEGSWGEARAEHNQQGLTVLYSCTAQTAQRAQYQNDPRPGHTAHLSLRGKRSVIKNKIIFIFLILGRILFCGAMGWQQRGWWRRSVHWGRAGPGRWFCCRRRDCYCGWGDWRHYWGVEHRTVGNFRWIFLKILSHKIYYCQYLFLTYKYN